MSAFTPRHGYAPRPVDFLGVREFEGGWRLKTYSIREGDRPLRTSLYDHALSLAAETLPRPAQTERRPGVGLAICHQGRDVHYLVLAWWDNENELPLRVLVNPTDGRAGWREALEHESICVWDLGVLWHEREAYVRHVLGPEQDPDIAAYLADGMAIPAP